MFSFLKELYVVFVLSFVLLHGVDPSAYDELRGLGVACYPKDSCRCFHSSRASRREKAKTCECDPAACHRRGTCCIDSPHVDLHPSARKEICSGEKIFGVRHNFYFTYLTDSISRKSYSFYQIVKCDSSWSGSVKVRQLCEEEEPINGADIMTAIPVTNFGNGISYKNYFCALCNNDITYSVLWDVSIFEGHRTDFVISDRFIVQAANNTYGGTTNDTCKDKSSLALVFNKVGGYYAYRDECSPGSSRYVPVTVKLSIPEKIKHHVKGCQPELISSCLPGWTDVRVKVLCESYFGIIKGSPPVSEYGTYYYQYFRNAHCALCNNVTNVEDYSCELFTTTAVVTPTYPTSDTIAFHQLLSSSECLEDQEQFSQGLSCRAGICANPLHKAQNGKCTLS